METLSPFILEIRDLWPDIFFDVAPFFIKPFIFFLNIFLDYKLKNSLKNADGIIGITDSYLNWALKKINRNKTQNDIVVQMAYEKNKNEEYLDEIKVKKIILEKFSFLNSSPRLLILPV